MIVITSPTGQIGSQLLARLLETSTRSEELRVIVRDPARLPDAVRSRVDIVTGSHGDPDVVDRAFTGADAVFWLVPPDFQAPSLDAAYSGFTRAAAKAFTNRGIGHVVSVSALGRGTPVAARAGHITASLAMDDLIASTGVAYRALTNPTFMDNLLWQAASIRDTGVFTGTTPPDYAAPTVATRDITAAAAHLLLDRSWTGTAEVPLLGPEDLTPNAMAHIMSEVLGRTIHYRHQSLDDLRASLTARGVTTAIADGYIDMMNAKNHGLDNAVPRTPANSTPTTFRRWCEQSLAPAVRA
ncbi:NAD(P)H-binding protein [Nocardia sp. CDC160]|uniref:NAD(P)H-binding protein n=1 Tax=Nocardia sp. CDC160 TaxID=3112166 RepID=UPI002DB5D6B8|nr:NAD(P)H-binding protein [Nocardia sp. CDC160]MEC3916195.1 NAD(P)H-binding protein [Nocardia sp. CDC160]